jgi:hypothetical protein
VRCIAWTDEAVADLLGDGEPEPVEDADLVVRYKPSETGIPTEASQRSRGFPLTRRGATSNRGRGTTGPKARPAWTRGTVATAPPDGRRVPGRFDLPTPPPESLFDDAVFAFRPAAFGSGAPRKPLTVLARLRGHSGRASRAGVLSRVFKDWSKLPRGRQHGARGRRKRS